MTTIRILCVSWIALLSACLAADRSAAQAILVDAGDEFARRLPRPWTPPADRPQANYRLESLAVDASLEGSVAKVTATQTFRNTGNATIEATFVFPLPYDGAIDQLTLLVDGKEIPGKLLTKEEARARYEAIVRKSRDPALLEWVGAGMYQTSVFPIPPGATRQVTMRYVQVCRKSRGLTNFVFPLSTARFSAEPVKELRLRIAISSPTDLKNIYSPSHNLQVERTDPRHAVATHQQSNVLTSDDFRLYYDAGAEEVGASLISYRPDRDDHGYFLLLASPEIPDQQDAAPKTVVFTIDRSGSMTGAKIEQAREAARFVLNHLREGDLFNILAYDDDVEAFRPELQRLTPATRSAALGFIAGLTAGGSTNLNEALVRTLEMCRDRERPTYVVFLTDGLPTAGTTGEGAIVNNSDQANKVRARLFPLGVGYDVNSRLLDKLARTNHGQSEYVRPNEHIEDRVSRLYQRIESPVLTDVQISLTLPGATAEQGPVLNRIYPAGPLDLFAGDQTVVVGRYQRGGTGKLRLTGNLRGEETVYTFDAELTAASQDDGQSFVGRLWATRRVGEIIDQIDLKGKNDELIEELVQLARQHGILTPYTSFLAEEEGVRLDESEAAIRASVATDALAEVDGALGVRQRAAKGALQAASAPAQFNYYAAEPASGGGGYGGQEAMLEQLRLSQGRGLSFYDPQVDRRQIAATVCQAGAKTFFRTGTQWIDATVTDEDRQQAIQIERYSREFFDLVARHGDHVGTYLALDGQVMIKLEGKTYQW